ncbi:MAG TPA: hypothetical protein VKM94_15430 [Blastocatellia bacterium]|nr:hypothetical protein [Blastocatellia bacterium]
MRRLIVIICVLLSAFAVASLFLYRTRVGGSHDQPASRRSIVSEVNTAEGQVEAVDVDSGTLKLNAGDQEVVFTFDDRTAILQSGHTIPPASLEAGTGVTVKYTKRGGKNWARRIELQDAERGD